MLIDKKNLKAVLETPQHPIDVSRRDLLRNVTIVVGGASVLAAIMNAPLAEADTAKMSQAGASYQTSPKNGQRCDGCGLFQAPSSCQVVEGTISPAGWCKFFTKKS